MPYLNVAHFIAMCNMEFVWVGCWKQIIRVFINPLPNNKILDWSKLNAFADDNIIVNKNLRFAFERVENIFGKGENAGHQHFLLFPKCFQKASFSGLFKVPITAN